LKEQLKIYGAKVHNLRNVNVVIPRNELVVITGLSGSGKSSLAFDTIYAEGQRRYMETFSAYARQFIGNLERPDVDQITGLSPVIAIEQKTTGKNPRSTVGTITEVYDFLRLLFARVADAYSYNTGEKMVRYTEDQVIDLILEKYTGRNITIMAPMVKGRKGHYRELFEQVRRQGFIRVRIDGEIREIEFGMQLDRYKIHDIEVVIDRFPVHDDSLRRVREAVRSAMKLGNGMLLVQDVENNEVKHYSKLLMCPSTGISYREPEPNTFSFNSPYGACEKCNGLGTISEVDLKKIIPDPLKSIKKGGLAPLGEYKNNWVFRQLEAIGEHFGFTLNTPLKDIPEDAIHMILHGSNEVIQVKNEYLGVNTTYDLTFEGIIKFIKSQAEVSNSKGIRKWAGGFMNNVPCPTCNGQRLKKESLWFRIDNKNISELAEYDLESLYNWLENAPSLLSDRQNVVAYEILRELKTRVGFLLDVGLNYLSLNRPARTGRCIVYS
jgi:excinuclease ABC subunit A